MNKWQKLKKWVAKLFGRKEEEGTKKKVGKRLEIEKLGTEEIKARKKIKKAKEIAESIIANAEKKAENLLREERIEEMAEEIVKGKKKELGQEAKEIEQKYEERREKIKATPEEAREELARMIVEEVLEENE